MYTQPDGCSLPSDLLPFLFYLSRSCFYFFLFFLAIESVSLILSYFYKIILKKSEINYLMTKIIGLLIPSFLTLIGLALTIYTSLNNLTDDNYCVKMVDIVYLIFIPLIMFIYYSFWTYKILKTKITLLNKLIKFSLAIYTPFILAYPFLYMQGFIDQQIWNYTHK